MSGRRVEAALVSALAHFMGILPWGAGQYRLADTYIRADRWPEGRTVTRRMRTGNRMELEVGDRTQALAYMLGNYSPEIIRYVCRALSPGGVFLDVGANVGLVTFGVAAKRRDVIVHAFEPNPANVDAWRRNRALNPFAHAELYVAAVSDRRGVARFAVPTDSGSGMLSEDGGFDVQTLTLDDYCAERRIERIDALKIDVQGHEEAVLRGARRLLSEGRIRAVVLETDEDPTAGRSAAMTGFLSGFGYASSAIVPYGLRRVRGARAHVPDVAFVRHLTTSTS